ncbi:hypothetical protein [Nocardia sp. NPDC059228]|uniref:hypothetical protein n=1 Tax=Nocardia sp. NPDC059228 TaxID=3346777 RepID=UPI0036CED901
MHPNADQRWRDSVTARLVSDPVEVDGAADTAAAARNMAAVRQVWLTAVWGTGIR